MLFERQKPMLSDLIKPEAVIPLINATSKKHLLQELASNISIVYDIKQSDVFSALQEREILGATGMGYGVAIPHAKLKSITDVRGLFLKLEKPIDFESIDHQHVDLVFALIAPQDSTTNHLKALAKVSRLLRRTDICTKLRSTTNRAAIFSILTNNDEIQAA